MGWASGSGLLSSVWTELRDYLPYTSRGKILANLMKIFEGEDADTLDELIYEFPEGLQAYKILYPETDIILTEDDIKSLQELELQRASLNYKSIKNDQYF